MRDRAETPVPRRPVARTPSGERDRWHWEDARFPDEDPELGPSAPPHREVGRFLCTKCFRNANGHPPGTTAREGLGRPRFFRQARSPACRTGGQARSRCRRQAILGGRSGGPDMAGIRMGSSKVLPLESLWSILGCCCLRSRERDRSMCGLALLSLAGDLLLDFRCFARFLLLSLLLSEDTLLTDSEDD